MKNQACTTIHSGWRKTCWSSSAKSENKNNINSAITSLSAISPPSWPLSLATYRQTYFIKKLPICSTWQPWRISGLSNRPTSRRRLTQCHSCGANSVATSRQLECLSCLCLAFSTWRRTMTKTPHRSTIIYGRSIQIYDTRACSC